jgi:hypothetical protein
VFTVESSAIRDRINYEKSRLAQIQTRAMAAETKIRAIQNTTNAVVVYSSAKYPAPGIFFFFFFFL